MLPGYFKVYLLAEVRQTGELSRNNPLIYRECAIFDERFFNINKEQGSP
jgi:hypothetical protein